MRKLITILLTALIFSGVSAQFGIKEAIQLDSIFRGKNEKTLIYTFYIRENIAAPVWRTTQQAMEEAEAMGADLVLLDMNTYGGEVSAADSIRTRLLNSKIPIYCFINDNAASAGALIALACDSIFMKPSAKIGAATVVNQTGEQVPDKYQSYMRATMRATAEAHGKDTLIVGGDTIMVWKRDPAIAESMVDPRLTVVGVVDSGSVLTFTATEALENNYCEAIVDSRKEIFKRLKIEEYELKQYNPSGLDKVIGVLINPMISGILIMVIVGGIYFEIQSPGIGFPLAASVLAALLYFAPLYLEGLAEYWELLIFIAGLILIMVELFAIPGFGIAGIAGIIAIITGLALSLFDNVVFEDKEFTGEGVNLLMKSFGLVIVSSFLGLAASLWAAHKLLTSHAFSKLALNTQQPKEEGYVGVQLLEENIIGKKGIAHTVLRPSGKVSIEDKIYDAKAEYGFIDKGETIKVMRYETGQIYVTKV
jgi:membrane-bound serine protease (ClpP class)